MRTGVRRRAYQVMQEDRADDAAARVFEIALSSLIVANVLAVALQTVPEVERDFAMPLAVFEVISVAIFTIEYLLRIWVAVEDPRYRHPLFGRLRYLLSAPALIDFVAIVPSVLSLGRLDLRFIRALRLVRLARVAKLGRYSDSLQVLLDVLSAKRGELISALAMLGLVLFVAASSMYVVEHSAQPELYSSIPTAMWLTVATFGGNVEAPPVTLLGKIIAGLITVISAGLFALPAGILAAGFSERIAQTNAAERSESEGVGAYTEKTIDSEG